jgi:anti-anti-sigma factor
LEFASARYGDAVVAVPSGRIDHAAAAPLEDALANLIAADGAAALVIDLANVEYISSVGLRVLMVAARQMRARHAPIAVAALQPVVTEIFAISRFDVVLPVHRSVRDALAGVAPGALPAFDAQHPALAP